MSWRIIDTGVASAQHNMDTDRQLLEELEFCSEPILHLYEWQSDAATFGHFVDPSKFLQMAAVSKYNLQLAQRPTGGGIIFHITDFAFSALVPASYPAFSCNTLDSYCLINRIVARAIKRFVGAGVDAVLLQQEPVAVGHCNHFCMAKPTKYDVMIDGLKVGGAAQRRTKHGFLHQGSIALTLPSKEYLQKLLQPKMGVLEAMQAHSCLLLGEEPSSEELAKGRAVIKALLIEEVKALCW